MIVILELIFPNLCAVGVVKGSTQPFFQKLFSMNKWKFIHKKISLIWKGIVIGDTNMKSIHSAVYGQLIFMK